MLRGWGERKIQLLCYTSWITMKHSQCWHSDRYSWIKLVFFWPQKQITSVCVCVCVCTQHTRFPNISECFALFFFKMIPFKLGYSDWYELEVPFSSPFHDILSSFSLISLRESGKAKRLSQKNFSMMKEHDIIICDKDIFC